jgi:hypothetical protein
MLGALTSDVILIFIFLGFTVGATLFMLTFLHAMMRELRNDRTHGIAERHESGPSLVTPERYHRQDRAA